MGRRYGGIQRRRAVPHRDQRRGALLNVHLREIAEAKQGHLTRAGLEALAQSMEPRMRRAVLDAVNRLRGEINMSALEAALRAQSLPDAEAALLFNRIQTELAPLVEAVQEGVAVGGRAAAAELATVVDVPVAFDLFDPNAVRWIQDHSAVLVREVALETQQAIRDEILSGFVDGKAPRTMARNLRGVLRGDRYVGGRYGLTQHQMQIVRNYEAALREAVRGDMSFDALNNRFRLNPIRGPGGLTESRIDSAVQQYADRWLKHRAETIARTEALTAAHRGQQEAWNQAVDRGILEPSTQKEWVATMDSRVRDSHAAADGERVLVGESFSLGVDHPPAGPNCRCTSVLVL